MDVLEKSAQENRKRHDKQQKDGSIAIAVQSTQSLLHFGVGGSCTSPGATSSRFPLTFRRSSLLRLGPGYILVVLIVYGILGSNSTNGPGCLGLRLSATFLAPSIRTCRSPSDPGREILVVRSESIVRACRVRVLLLYLDPMLLASV